MFSHHSAAPVGGHLKGHTGHFKVVFSVKAVTGDLPDEMVCKQSQFRSDMTDELMPSLNAVWTRVLSCLKTTPVDFLLVIVNSNI